ncbi:hypothetical protein V8B97DRAFT_943195 [Scleroderma yunnanense]
MAVDIHLELVVNVIRDEKVWRWATKKKGAKVPTNPLISVFGSRLNRSVWGPDFNLAAALFIFAFTLMLVECRRQNGPKPAAYGYIQTLANLINEWLPVMRWGDKPVSCQSQFRHAGGSDSPLPLVRMGDIQLGHVESL